MTEVTQKQEQQPTEVANPGQPVANPSQQSTGIQISDLQMILNIIDLASSRGAFRAQELTQVGGIADKLNSFLSEIAAQAKAKEEQAKAKEEGTVSTAETPAPAETPTEAK